MIVKDESAVIRRCLNSVMPLIDYWVIVDTGSMDGTQQIICEHLRNIPGELYERPWKSWEETRNEALDLARGKGDYILFMDADDILEYQEGFQWPLLLADQYNLWLGDKNFSYLKPHIVKGSLPWRWVGVVHEYLNCFQPVSTEILEEVHYTTLSDGSSHSDPEKFWKYVRLLEEGIKREPNNHRYAFYLGESYRDAGEKAKALEWFQKRVQMGGWAEEVFLSKLQIGHMLKELKVSNRLVLDAYSEAFEFRPHRSEGLYYLVEMHQHMGNYEVAYKLLKDWETREKPKQKDILFNQEWIGRYGLMFQLSICSYYVGKYEESLQLCDQLIQMVDLPVSWRQRAIENREFPLKYCQGRQNS